jgi:hypothetical protein
MRPTADLHLPAPLCTTESPNRRIAESPVPEIARFRPFQVPDPMKGPWSEICRR